MNTASLIACIPALRRYARALTGDAWAADDLVQDTLERACAKWRLWIVGTDLRAWLFTVMHNVHANQARRRPSSRSRVDIDDVAHELAGPDTDTSAQIDLQRCLLQLPDEQRAVLLLVALEDFNYQQVAHVLDIPIGTVMSRLSRARSRLRELMDGHPTSAAHPHLRRLKQPSEKHSMTSSSDSDEPQVWQAQDDALRGLHRNVLDEAIPSGLLETVARAADRRQALQLWRRWGAMAASVTVAFAGGWSASGQWSARQAPAQVAQAGEKAFIHDASVAHAVYSPEKRHPVEVSAAEQQHLVQWLSRRLDRPLKVPDLSALGYTLVGGRLLPGEDGARAQFMFQDAKGQRVTLYIGAMTPFVESATSSKASNETAFRFAANGPVSSFYWVDQGFGYALAGDLPRDALLAIATAAYPQI